MNILVIRYSSLGDLITLSGMFKAIRHFFPSAHITLLSSPLGEGLYGDSNYFDDYVISSGHKKHALLASKQLRGKKYDIVFNLQCNRASHITTLFIKKNKNICSAGTFLQKIMGKKTVVKDQKETLIEAKCEKEKVHKYYQTQNKLSLIAKKTEIKNADKNKKTVAISIGSSEKWLSKQWGADKYGELIKNLLKDGLNVVLVGTKLELKESQNLKTEQNKIINLVDKTSLAQLKSLLFSVDLFIGNDSGPVHVAAAVGTPTISVFTSTDTKHSVKSIPYGGLHECFSPPKQVRCYPCYKGICPKKNGEYMECAKSISSDEVYQKAKEFLSGS